MAKDNLELMSDDILIPVASATQGRQQFPLEREPILSSTGASNIASRPVTLTLSENVLQGKVIRTFITVSHLDGQYQNCCYYGFVNGSGEVPGTGCHR